MTTPNTITAAQNWLANTNPPADYETNSLQKQFSFTPEKQTIHHGHKGYTIFADDDQQRRSVPYQAPKDDEYSYDFHTRKVASEHKVSSKPIEERPKQSSPHKVAYKNLFTEDQQRDSYKTEGALTARTFSPIAYQATPEKEKKSSTNAAFKSLFSNEGSPISYHQNESYQTSQKPSPVKGEIILKGNEQPKLLKERETLIREFRAQYLLNNQGEYKPNVEKQQYEENCYYEGNFAYDRKTGKGVYFYANGDAYMGDWVDNYFHGTGTYFFANGERYEGQLENGMKHGKGTYHYLEFKRYSGEWINDRKHGRGVYDYYGIKEKYDGDFVKGKRHGMGTYYYANGDKWFGQWRNNERVETDVKEPIEVTKSIEIKEPIEVRETVEIKKPVEIPQERVVRKAAPPQLQKKNTITSAQLRGDGEGIIIFPNTDTFEGRWKSGLFYGMGVYSYSNGDRYEGEWKDSFKNGQGTLTIDRTQDKYVGSWQRDQQNGQGVLTYGDGDRYEGEWRHGRRHGFGTMMFKNGDVYTGQWENGFRQGKGIYKFHNGDTYEGLWQHDRKNGNGIYRWKDGSKYDGLWINDEIDQNQLHYSGYYDASQPTGPIQPDANLYKNLYL